MLRTLFSAASAAVLVASAGDVLAQNANVAQAPASAQLVAGCEDAAARVNGATLPRVGASAWTDWVTLTGCGTRGATIIAGALQSDAIRGESELSRLDHLTGLLDGWFQPQLVNAYQFILRSPESSNGMKLRAMWLLSGLYAPSVDVAGPLQGYMSAKCETYDRNTNLRDAPERLPESAYDEARGAILAAANDRMAPEYLRSTARCWDNVIDDEVKHGTVVEDDAPQVVHASNTTVVVERPIRVVYDCDNRFVFYNDAGYDLAVRYSGYSSGVLRVGRGGPLVWTSARFGPVRFWMGDTEIYYADAVYRPCYGRRVIVGGPIYPWGGWHAGLGVYIRVGPVVVSRVRYIVPRHYSRRVYTRPIIVPRVVRPIIVNPGRRDNDDYNRRRDNDDRSRYATPTRGRDDRGNNNDRNRNSGYYGSPPAGGDRPEPRRENRGSNGRSEGYYGRPAATPAPAPRAEAPQMPVEKPRGRPDMPRVAVPKGGEEKKNEGKRGGDDHGDRRGGRKG
jgi:hypothetical protein